MKIFNAEECPLDGKVFIEASAGTGKTYSIGLLVIRLLTEKLLPIEKIVLITFTEKATKELKQKTAEKIQEVVEKWKDGDLRVKANLQDAMARIDEMPVFTIHGFCQKILTDFTFETGNAPNLELITNDIKIVEHLVADFWRENLKNENLGVDIKPADLAKVASVALRHPKADIAGENNADSDKAKKYGIVYEFAKSVKEKFTEETKKERVLTFIDMIKNTHIAIKNEKREILRSAIQKRYDAIFVDEFQDTDKMQFEIFDYLFDGKPFFMIGDPKQAIYGFRGGDIFVYLEAKNKMNADRQFTMDTNYRSEKNLLASLDDFFTKTTMTSNAMGDGINYTKIHCGKTDLNPICEKDGKYENPLIIWRGKNQENKIPFDRKVKDATIGEIARLLKNGIEPKQIAILTATNEQAIEFKNKLTDIGIAVVVKGKSVFDSDSAMFIRILLRAICEPKIKYINALLTHKFYGYEPKNITGEIANNCIKICCEAKGSWQRIGIAYSIDSFFRKENLWAKIASEDNGDRNITNIRQIIEILDEEENTYGRTPERICEIFDDLCCGNRGNEKYEERLETDDDALQIMTIHKSKGLEFDIVFIPDVSKSPSNHKFPEPNIYHSGKEIIDFSADAKEEAKEEMDNEIARLLYVAMTRAKYRLYVAFNSCWNRSKSICREIFDSYCGGAGSWHSIENVLGELSKHNSGETERRESGKADRQREVKIFNGNAEWSWQTTSFSKLEKNIQINEEWAGKGRAAEFPSGARAGTILHSIFEQIEFDNAEEYNVKVEENLKNFSEQVITQEQREWAKNQVRIVLKKELRNGIKLCDLPKEKRSTELEFLMNIEKINILEIAKFFRDNYGYSTTETEQTANIKTYLKGFIDLVFQAENGMYYIVDWKSNFLGNEQDDYSANSMEREMQKHKYHLQYYIYAMALIGYLKKIKDDFNYEKDFGGIFYIFLRGINDKNSDGIYFDKPTEENINKFRQYFEGGR